MENNDHVTKADLKLLREELKGDMKGLEDRLTELMRDIETKLLKVFYDFAEMNEKRVTGNKRAVGELDERLAMVERRVMDIEKRLNFPQSS